MNSSTAESNAGYLGSMSVSGAAHSVKLSESWPQFKFFSCNEMLKTLVEGQKKVPRVTKIYVFEQMGWFCFRYRQKIHRC